MDHELKILERAGGFPQPEERSRDRDINEAIAALLPYPRVQMNDLDPDTSLQAAKEGWLELEVMDPLIARWTAFAAGIPECVDSMVGFLKTAPLDVQTSRGLDLATSVINGDFGAVARRTYYLVGWLEQLKSSRTLRGDALAKLQLIVDGLAAHGDSRAAQLQQSLE
jgi:hypothetical protein